jgi:hypothetical protein
MKYMCILCKQLEPYTGTRLCDNCIDIYRSGALHAYGILGEHGSVPQGAPALARSTSPICPIETQTMTNLAPKADLDALFSLRMFLYRISRDLDSREPIVYSPRYAAIAYVGPLAMP